MATVSSPRQPTRRSEGRAADPDRRQLSVVISMITDPCPRAAPATHRTLDPHDTRHSRVSRLVAQGEHPKLAANRLGHPQTHHDALCALPRARRTAQTGMTDGMTDPGWTRPEHEPSPRDSERERSFAAAGNPGVGVDASHRRPLPRKGGSAHFPDLGEQ